MRSVLRTRRSAWFALGSLPVLLVFVLAACGYNSGGSTNTGSGSTTGTTPTTSASAYGCPGSVMTTTPAPANIVLKPSNSNSTVTAHVGDVVEIELPFGQAWTGPMASQGELQLQGTAGSAVTASKVCVWRFTAQGTGTTQVEFYGRAICQKGQMCPAYITRIPYTIVVQ